MGAEKRTVLLLPRLPLSIVDRCLSLSLQADTAHFAFRLNHNTFECGRHVLIPVIANDFVSREGVSSLTIPKLFLIAAGQVLAHMRRPMVVGSDMASTGQLRGEEVKKIIEREEWSWSKTGMS